VEYQDIAGGNYWHDWEIDPGLYEDLRTQGYRNMDDLVDAVEHVAEEIGGDEDRRSARMRKPYPTDLSLMKNGSTSSLSLPTPKGYGRPRIHSLREILNATFYVLRSGCQWRMLPHDFPRWPTV